MTEAKKTVYLPIPWSCTDTITMALVDSAINILVEWKKAQPSVHVDEYLPDALDAIKTAVELRKS